MAKKRTTAQRRAAAKQAWALRRLRSAGAPTPVVENGYAPLAALPATPPVTISVTKEGADFYVGINNNGSLHRVKVLPDTLKTMALDALRII